jgi:hypothetical protein
MTQPSKIRPNPVTLPASERFLFCISNHKTFSGRKKISELLYRLSRKSIRPFFKKQVNPNFSGTYVSTAERNCEEGLPDFS